MKALFFLLNIHIFSEYYLTKGLMSATPFLLHRDVLIPKFLRKHNPCSHSHLIPDTSKLIRSVCEWCIFWQMARMRAAPSNSHLEDEAGKHNRSPNLLQTPSEPLDLLTTKNPGFLSAVWLLIEESMEWKKQELLRHHHRSSMERL